MKKDFGLQDETLRVLSSATVYVASDIHFPYQDDKAIGAFLSAVKEGKPDIIVLNGDLLDFYKLSRFSKDPSGKNPEEEIEMCKNFLQKLRDTAGRNPRIYYTIGNHESRLRKYILDNAPMVASLMDNVFRLLKLEDYDIVGCGSLTINDTFVFEHGTRLGNKSGLAAIKELEAHYMSGATGHVHRLAKFSTLKSGKRFIWLETGCLCDLNPEYMLNADWEQGFGIVKFRDGKFFDAQVISIKDGEVIKYG